MPSVTVRNMSACEGSFCQHGVIQLSIGPQRCSILHDSMVRRLGEALFHLATSGHAICFWCPAVLQKARM